ncbi:hypothetical protein [Clostridium sp. BNL1100]|uniref:hypothetical protein n=1 Tax=Clostridium sp. BNL1100 TaxID=755731 RepID=UPI00024A7B37|nr:hypothetical protein [Clostridium sp. BNL1100]AEY64897.1 hypothetical protein Clo1100_0625 [Clostridium sp. BNL1100]
MELIFVFAGVAFLIALIHSIVKVFFLEEKWETLIFSNGLDNKNMLEIYSYLRSEGIKCIIVNLESDSGFSSSNGLISTRNIVPQRLDVHKNHIHKARNLILKRYGTSLG